MKIKLLFATILCISSLGFGNNVAQAYFTTDQNVIRINNDLVLFSITYEFGVKKYDILMPIQAKGSKVDNNTDNILLYSLKKNTGGVVNNEVNAIVLSNAEITNNQYYIPKNTRKKFTLIALVNEKGIGNSSVSDLSLQVNSLPFTLVDDNDRKFQNGLNQSELKYYVAKAQ